MEQAGFHPFQVLQRNLGNCLLLCRKIIIIIITIIIIGDGRRVVSSSSSSSSCSGRIRFDFCSLYPQNEIGPSISSSVVLCVLVLLVYIVVLV